MDALKQTLRLIFFTGLGIFALLIIIPGIGTWTTVYVLEPKSHSL